MPFIERVVEPKFVSRTSLRDEDGRPRISDQELQAVTNCTLTNALRQLASLVILAEDIFSELTVQLQGINERSKAAQKKIDKINELVENFDPKKVPVPEGSLSDFALRKVHYTAQNPVRKELFTPDTRPRSVRTLYEKATSGRVPGSLLDQLRKDSQHSPYLLCTPVLGTKRRRLYQKIDVDIETRIPSVVEQLRKWTSREAIGEVTALPDASMRITSGVTLTPDELTEASGDDEPIDHRLPSPEEQLKIIASKFLPEVVAIDTSGKFFDRMCSSRKSLIHIEANAGETDTVKRRTRTRKPRGKRRNTISGTDQKELREAVAGDTSTAVAPEEIDESSVIRSHSSDLLKKSPIDIVIKKGHFNTLKQWGKNRLKMINRSPSASRDSFKENLKSDRTKDLSPRKEDAGNDIQEPVTMRKKRTSENDHGITQERCASYSSSEKSIGVPSSSVPTATINPGVKLRASSVQRRLRRSGAGKDEPHSSSGNWSASSESGRTSIGSEITTTTIPPKSTTSATTSNNSLSLHSHGPPSSIISRRRFLNTSGSGSVTSEGTLTPDIIHDFHEDMETSSEFSCDTEGYYTSFHMDSGLKTLKEEDVSPSTPMHTSNALSNSSASQTLTAENEYELFGKGSTSTTTSSAGTVCTTLMAAGSDRSLITGPTVPERKSSLCKFNRNRANNNSNANTTLDRNNSSLSNSSFNSLRYNSVRGFTDKSTYNHSSPETNDVPNSRITITRNVGNEREMTSVVEVHTEAEIESAKKSTGTNSPDSGHNTSSSPIEDSVSSAQGKNSLSEQDYSESSDLEGTDRIERIRFKTTINSSRIPSLCVITPTNSDDESETSEKDANKQDLNMILEVKLDKKIGDRPRLEVPLPAENPKDTKRTNVDSLKTVNKAQTQINLKPFNNFMCKLKGVLPHKNFTKKGTNKENDLADDFCDVAGDYVTIADVRNNNQKIDIQKGIHGSNDVVKKNLQTVLSGKLPDTEYVSLNELPNCLNESKDYLEHGLESPTTAFEEVQKKGAKVTLDSQGQVIYSSDTLKRRKGAHTTFEPGPFVQEINPTTSVLQRGIAEVIRVPNDETDFPYDPPPSISKPTSPQLGKVIIKAPIEFDGPVTTEFITLPAPKPSTIITATPVTENPPSLTSQPLPVVSKNQQIIPRVIEAITRTGAYVNIHDAEGISLSPTKDDLADSRHSSADKSHRNLAQQYFQTRDDTHLAQHRTAQLRSRHGVVAYNQSDAFQKGQPVFWTLPKKTLQDVNYRNTVRESIHYPEMHPEPMRLPLENQSHTATNVQDESIKISPIDPRTSSTFKSSTPSNKENVLCLGERLLSPKKSTMTNEELYAVIHKSKKKLNIKDPIERADSPALSSVSLSPVSSENSLILKGTQKYPETGYLVDAKSRSSYSSSDKFSSYLPGTRIYTGLTTESTCADRLGPTPQTSRMDFKKLLLRHSVKLNTINPQQQTHKLSAVEQLKLSKEKSLSAPQSTNNTTQMNILDLSASPKIYHNRKNIKPIIQPASPGRTSALIKEHKSTPKILLSPKSQWRFSSPRSDVLSSPILEVNNEDENSNSSGDKAPSPEGPNTKTVPIITNQHFGARRNLIPISELDQGSTGMMDQGVFPLHIEPKKLPSMSRTEYLQAKRAEFFNSPTPESSPPQFTSFKKSPTAPSNIDTLQTSPERGKISPTTLETAL